MRIDKYLANMQNISRQEIKKYIKNNCVLVDGKIITDPGFKVDPEKANVTLNGKTIRYEKNRYIMMNKPAGVVSATHDDNDTTVIDLLPKELGKDMFPVGRLDKDTVGLLILTNDGELSHRLLSPRNHVEKTYCLKTDLPLDDTDVLAFADGIELKDGTGLLPARLMINDEDKTEATVIISEGKYHQIKRMIASRGKKVLFLKRVSMGPIMLDPKLKEGSFRTLDDTEIALLKNS